MPLTGQDTAARDLEAVAATGLIGFAAHYIRIWSEGKRYSRGRTLAIALSAGLTSLSIGAFLVHFYTVTWTLLVPVGVISGWVGVVLMSPLWDILLKKAGVDEIVVKKALENKTDAESVTGGKNTG